MDDDKLPRFGVRKSGLTPPRHVKRIWVRLAGGKYEGSNNLDIGFARVVRVSFAGIEFEHFYADGAAVNRCDFSGAAINGSFGVNRQTTFEDCQFVGTRLSGVEPGQARFVRCSFDGADLSGWNAVANELIDCRFSGLLKRCNFWGAPVDDWLAPGHLKPRRTRNEFRGNDFRAAELRDVSFVGGIEIGAQLWPASDEYIRLDRLPERIAQARPIVEAWTDPVGRKLGLIMLAVYSEAGFEQQAELFAHRSLEGIPKAIAEQVWAALAASDIAGH